MKEKLKQLNIIAQCHKYGLPVWQCPHFIFILMGATIVVVSVVVYGTSSRYIEDPELNALIVFGQIAYQSF